MLGVSLNNPVVELNLFPYLLSYIYIYIYIYIYAYSELLLQLLNEVHIHFLRSKVTGEGKYWMRVSE
jgi:hypothetical protein